MRTLFDDPATSRRAGSGHSSGDVDIDDLLATRRLKDRLAELCDPDSHLRRLLVSDVSPEWEESPLTRVKRAWIYALTFSWIRDVSETVNRKLRDIRVLGVRRGLQTSVDAVKLDRILSEYEEQNGNVFYFLAWRWIMGEEAIGHDRGEGAVSLVRELLSFKVGKKLAYLAIAALAIVLFVTAFNNREQVVEEHRVEIGDHLITPLVMVPLHLKLPPAKKLSGGGGGGLKHPLPATYGKRIPKFRPKPNPVAPPPVIDPPPMPKIAIEPELLAKVKIDPPNKPDDKFGDPKSANRTQLSNGPGTGAGIGTGTGAGIGPGTGRGYGPGNGGGIGGGNLGGEGAGIKPDTMSPPRVLEDPPAETDGKIDDVAVYVIVTPDGRADLGSIQLERGHEELYAAVRAVLPRWKFKPAERNGVPVRSRFRIVIHFRQKRV